MIVTDEDKIKDLFERYIETVLPSKEKAAELLKSGQKLSFYLGIDPTGPDIHLGHSTNFFVLKKLVNLGHKVILLMGDFTALIGDPTGKDDTRKVFSEEEIKNNMSTYIDQANKILTDNSYEVKNNSQWLNKLSFKDLIKISSHFTVQQMIVREMFQRRLKENKPIGIHEFLYPLAQGYDSVAMEVDGEIGGNDQTFNMLVGRDLSKSMLNKEKLVITTKLLEDPVTGKKIMSKSDGRYISMNDNPQEIRRKILAVDDSMTKVIFELCTEKDMAWIESESKKEPRQFKEELADELVRIYHGDKAIGDAHKPIDFNLAGETMTISNFVKGVTGATMSGSKELINQGAVEVNGEAVKEWSQEVKEGDIVKIGKGKIFKAVK